MFQNRQILQMDKYDHEVYPIKSILACDQVQVSADVPIPNALVFIPIYDAVERPRPVLRSPGPVKTTPEPSGNIESR